jgi:hypothetical protein
MRIKIDENARNLYKENCPFSYAKCESISEVDYKIQRCVDLGRWKALDQDLSFFEVLYHKKKLVILNGKLIDMFTSDEPEYKVSERAKEKHYNTYYKVMI